MTKYPVNTLGLSLLDEKEMQKAFEKYPSIQKVTLFGSRAKGTFQAGSDIDLAVEISEKERRPAKKILISLHDELEEETNIPYFFDVINVHTLTSPELQEHIRVCGQVLYLK